MVATIDRPVRTAKRLQTQSDETSQDLSEVQEARERVSDTQVDEMWATFGAAVQSLVDDCMSLFYRWKGFEKLVSSVPASTPVDYHELGAMLRPAAGNTLRTFEATLKLAKDSEKNCGCFDQLRDLELAINETKGIVQWLKPWGSLSPTEATMIAERSKTGRLLSIDELAASRKPN